MRPQLSKLTRFIAMTCIGAAGTYAALRSYRQRGSRRSLLMDGRIRELASLWSDVDGCIMHARASKLPQKAATLPVVCVHGFGISSSYFVPTSELLAAEFDVYAPDLPGHGCSQTPARPLDIPSMDDALVRWMDVVGLQRASMVANSMGCQIAVDAAVRHPDRIARLVLIGPTMDPSARNLLELIRRFAIGGMYERPSLTMLVLKDYWRMSLRLIPELRFMLRDPIEDKLPHVHPTSMLVRGENDTIAPQAWVDQVGQLIRAQRIVVIPRWGHAVHFSAAEQLVRAITPFLRASGADDNTARSGTPRNPTARTNYIPN